MATYTTALEHYIKGSLRTRGVGTLSKIYIQKALVLINKKLTNPCCTDPDATIDLLTRTPSVFINTIESLINAIPKSGNVQSLTRAKNLLQKRLDCCPIV